VALEAEISRRLAGLHPAKEGLKGPAQTGKHILQDVAMDVGILQAAINR
jgi:hypothetical protein